MDYVVTLLTGLLIGIIPSSTITKNIIVKMKFKGDLSNKTISFIFDLTKGVVIVLISKYFFNFDFMGIMISLIIGVLSHGFIQGFNFITVEGQFLALSGLSIFGKTKIKIKHFIYYKDSILYWVFFYIFNY